MHEALKILVPIIVAHVVVLTAVLLFIKQILSGDTKRAVARINEVEAEVRKKEETIRREIEEHEKDFARKRAEAEQALGRQKEESEKEVLLLRDQITGEARKDAERIIDQAKKNEQKMRQQIAQQMEEKAVDYGAEVFKLVFSREIDQELNRHFLNELMDALQEVDATSITVDPSEAEFTSSHPIDAEQKKRLEQLIKEKFGGNVEVNEKVDERLLAGLVMKLGSLEIDGSLLNRYNEAAGEVKKSVFATA